MINSKADYKYYLECDKISLGISRKKPRFYSDDIWKFERLLRKYEYLSNCKSGFPYFIHYLYLLVVRYLFARLSIKLGFTIPINVFGPGLCIVHHGSIVVSEGAKVGSNCRIHEGVTIGATNKSSKAATICDNVFIGTGAKISGDVFISSNVAIGVNAVVVKDIKVSDGCTVGGIPARIISSNDSSSNIIKATQIYKSTDYVTC